jgi:hypothetical protein
MLERPENGELPEAEKADRLSTGEAAQTPDVKPICQCSPIIIPQSVDIPKHAERWVWVQWTCRCQGSS